MAFTTGCSGAAISNVPIPPPQLSSFAVQITLFVLQVTITVVEDSPSILPLTPLPSSPPTELTSKVPSTSSNKYNPLGESDEDRLEKLFSRSYQQETEEQKSRLNRPVDTLSDKYQAVLEGQKQRERGKEEEEEGEGGKNEGGDAPQPMVIDFTQLLARQSFPLPPDTTPAVAPARPSAPMDVPSPR